MTEVEAITPYGSGGDGRNKGEQVRDMFDNIASAYDPMNRFMSLGTDRLWRRRCVALVREDNPTDILDLATGTGDLAVAMAKTMGKVKITGADLSEGMLEVGRVKARRKGLADRIEFVCADAMALPFGDDSFDALTIAFGVRNFEHLDAGYAEMYRVLRPGGKLVVLELSQPRNPVVKPFYKLYTRFIIPMVGRVVSHDTRAYAYLPESIAAVPARDEMTALMTQAGFREAKWQSLTLGTATIYTATK